MSGPWLAIDTATDVASVALGTAEGVRGARAVAGARQHAAQIIELVHDVLTLSAARMDELVGIVVADGPGSFTGLRIGWAAAKGLAEDRALPLRAVPALMAAAHAGARGEVGPVAACFDALRGEVFAAVYAFPPGRVETLVAPALFTLPALARVAPVRPLIAVGDGAVRWADEVAQWTGRPPVAPAALPPTAAALLSLAGREGAGHIVAEPATAEPVYGRPAEAQARWEARHGRPLPRPSR